jgi:hypothetical protein
MRPRFSSASQVTLHPESRAKSLDALGGGVEHRARTCHPTRRAKDELRRVSLFCLRRIARPNSWHAALPPQGGGVQRRLHNRQHHAICVAHHFIRPKPLDAIALRVEPLRPPRVVRYLRFFAMLTAINFNNEPPFETNEVSDVNSNWMLAAKSQSAGMAIAQGAPAFSFWSVHCATEFAGTFVCHCACL